VTVCVAALCEGGSIFGASDRMLTAGDVQFEPESAKIRELTTSIALMTAGDTSLQTEIFYRVRFDVVTRINSEPKNWWLAKDVADLCAKYYSEIKRERSERAILSPLGLTAETFVSRQREMSDSFVRNLTTELINFSMPAVATIVAGSDMQGEHIYVVTDGDVECYDAVGFAAIGIGRWHANSQFMFAGHHRARPIPETLLLTYAAKRRAEVSPGVGAGTDMFSIGATLGSYVRILPSIVDDLGSIYENIRNASQEAIELGNQEVRKYVETLAGAATSEGQKTTPTDAGGNPSVDQKELRDGAQESKPEDSASAGATGEGLPATG
jgi:hypothetical protein